MGFTILRELPSIVLGCCCCWLSLGWLQLKLLLLELLPHNLSRSSGGGKRQAFERYQILLRPDPLSISDTLLACSTCLY